MKYVFFFFRLTFSIQSIDWLKPCIWLWHSQFAMVKPYPKIERNLHLFWGCSMAMLNKQMAMFLKVICWLMKMKQWDNLWKLGNYPYLSIYVYNL
jgi:hypothetical protein